MSASVLRVPYDYLSAEPLFTACLPRWPSLPRVILMRVGFPSFGSTSMTFEMWIGIGFSTIWPLRPDCVALRWRFTRLRPSSTTVFFFGNARTTVEVSPRFLPTITSTLSPFLSFICEKLDDLRRHGADL